MNTWEAHDKQEAGTVYWNHITNPDNQFRVRLVELLRRHRILLASKEFIMYPGDAVRLIDNLTSLGVAVYMVGVWCAVRFGESKEECCPMGYGGPAIDGEWFSEYVFSGYIVPDFHSLPKNLELATHCNPLVKDYIQFQLPNESSYNERIRVSPSLYVPLMWDLFPNSDERDM